MTLAHLDEVLTVTAALTERFRARGHRLYLVGGVVRDLWLDRHLDADIDLTTDAHPEQTRAAIAGWADAVWTQGERFGTIGCTHAGREYEITTHRAEAYDPASRKPEVTFSSDIESDLSRRDFTVNAMAIELPEGELVDPFGGVADLQQQRLRTPLSPEESFSDDPLRMLRAARFAAGYGLEPHRGLLDAIERMVSRIDIVAVERVRDELEKLAVVDDPTAAFELLHSTGLLTHVVQGRLDPAEAGAVMAATPAVLDLRLAGLFWALTQDAADAHRQALRLRFPKDRARSIERVLAAARALLDGRAWSRAELRRWVRDTEASVEAAVVLARGIATQHPERVVDIDRFEARLAELAEHEDLSDLEPPLDGDAVMALLGLEPGPEVGEALDHLAELRIEEGPLTPDDAAARLRTWWAGRRGRE